MNLENIDPSLGLLGNFSKITKGTTSHLNRMRDVAIFNDGIFSAKTKALVAALWGVSARCEPCLKFYAQKARSLGATEEELGEMMAIASAMGGCVGEMWALKAYAAFMDQSKATQACCNA